MSAAAAKTTTPAGARPLNAVTVDVEDWLQAVVDPRLPLSDRFRVNTRRVLECFARRGVKGTFFVLGLAAEKAPELVREIQSAGHEIQSHGYGHELIHRISPEHFRRDIERGKKLLEDITGAPITGYRAPAFSITLDTLWALDAIYETGFRCDASIFPKRMRRYGIDGAPWYPHRLRTPRGYVLDEVPVATWPVAGGRVAVGGGGYFRLFPYFVLQRGVRSANRADKSAAIYMHPYEFDPTEMRELDHPVPCSVRWRQGLGRRGFAGKVDRLLRDFRFGSIREMLASCGPLTLHEHRPPAA